MPGLRAEGHGEQGGALGGAEAEAGQGEGQDDEVRLADLFLWMGLGFEGC